MGIQQKKNAIVNNAGGVPDVTVTTISQADAGNGVDAVHVGSIGGGGAGIGMLKRVVLVTVMGFFVGFMEGVDGLKISRRRMEPEEQTDKYDALLKDLLDSGEEEKKAEEVCEGGIYLLRNPPQNSSDWGSRHLIIGALIAPRGDNGSPVEVWELEQSNNLIKKFVVGLKRAVKVVHRPASGKYECVGNNQLRSSSDEHVQVKRLRNLTPDEGEGFVQFLHQGEGKNLKELLLKIGSP